MGSLTLERNLRLVDNTNLMMAYPGDATSEIGTIRRAAEVLQKSQGFDCVIDAHDVGEFGDTTAVIDRRQGITPKVLGFLDGLGVKNLVLSDGMGMHHYVSNSFVLEMGPELGANRLRTGFASLANNTPSLQPCAVDDFNWFEFLDSLHEKHLHPDTLSTKRFDELQPFMEFPELASALGKRAYLMAWNRQLNKEGYWGELVTPSGIPDTSQWPGNHTSLPSDAEQTTP